MNVDFITAIKLYFANYFNFSGRSTRAEFWFAMLFIFIGNMIFQFIPVLSTIWSLAILIPTIAISIRRFHDAGKSTALFIVLLVVSIIGAIMAIGGMLSCLRGAVSDNPTMLAEQVLGGFSSPLFIVGALVVVASYIYQLIIFVTPSQPDNKYGLNPYPNEFVKG